MGMTTFHKKFITTIAKITWEKPMLIMAISQ